MTASFWRSAAAALVLAVSAAAPAFAQTDVVAPGQSGERVFRSPDVVVTAPTPRQVLRDFVGEVSAAGQLDQLARWDRAICPGVAGMRRNYAQAMIDRLALIAHHVGLEVGAPGCDPNVLIYVTEDSDALARELVTQHAALVSVRNRAGNTRGRDALDDFAGTPRPVRWWHVTETVSVDGFQVLQGESTTVRSMGRLNRGVREDFRRAIVIVDARRIDGFPLRAVADYVAMAALAQLDPDADLEGAPTILNLFVSPGSSRPAGLTGWDLAYLRGLYSATRVAVDADSQEREIARQMQSEAAAEGLHWTQNASR